MILVKPPTMISQGEALGADFSLFLGGSIEMGKAENWQKRVEDYFANTNLMILNPRRDDWVSSWEQKYENPQFYQQVEWEMDAQDYADAILYHFDPGTISPITLLELGAYGAKAEKPVYVSCPEGYARRGNVQIFCERHQLPFFSSLDAALKQITKDFLNG